MDRWHAMKVFVKVADAGGFAEAARQLQMSAAAVTRAVAALEAGIGARLLIRTTRSLKLSEAGSRYLEDCRRILAAIDEAEAAAGGSYAKPSGTLTVTAPTLFGRIYVLPLLTDYLQQYPAVTGRTVFVDRVSNLVDEGIDVAVRIGHLPDSSLRALPVGTVRRVVCAAPAYFARHGLPRQPGDLEPHTIIATSTTHSAEWRFRGSSVRLRPRLRCNTIDAALDAAISGWGVASLLSYQVAPALADGRLQIALGEFEEAPLPIHVVHTEGAHAAAKVRSFVDFAVTRLRANPLIR